MVQVEMQVKKPRSVLAQGGANERERERDGGAGEKEPDVLAAIFQDAGTADEFGRAGDQAAGYCAGTENAQPLDTQQSLTSYHRLAIEWT